MWIEFLVIWLHQLVTILAVLVPGRTLHWFSWQCCKRWSQN